MTRTRGAVAAVIPVRNEITNLAVLVESLLNQTEPIDELVIVDGGSVDGTTEMAMELADGDPRISVVVAGPASPGRGRNLGIEATSAPWLLLVDAGISVDGSLVEMLMARRDADSQCRMVLGSRRIQADPRWRAAAIITGIRERECVEGQWGRFDLIPSLLDRQLWEGVGGFEDSRIGELARTGSTDFPGSTYTSRGVDHEGGESRWSGKRCGTLNELGGDGFSFGRGRRR